MNYPFALQWSYSLTEEAEQRIPSLLNSPSFAQITERVASEMAVLCCHRSEIEGTDFCRPVYTVTVGKPLFDLFFNSITGYRAAYYQSPGLGLDANVSFLQRISQRLIEDQVSGNSKLPPEFLQQSLSTPSAKAWLVEHGKELDRKCPGCVGEWSSGASGPADRTEIISNRWELATGQKAEWGRKAPYFSKLRIMGAFLDEKHHELVPFDKRFRSYDIHRYGWS